MQSFAITAAALVGSALAANEPYHSGAVSTFETFQYGQFGTRMKASTAKGTVSSFFTFWNGDDEQAYDPLLWNEIDVEIVPSTKNPFATNIHYGGNGKHNKDPAQVQDFDPADDFHTYWIIWTPEYIAWKLDGKEIRRVTDQESSNYINKFQKLHMDFWTPQFAGWGDNFNDATMPWYVLYDWVEAWDYVPETKGFKRRWRDDMTSLDLSRWNVANGWSYSLNSSVYKASNVYSSKGRLTFRMNKANWKPKAGRKANDREFMYAKPCNATHDLTLCEDRCDLDSCHASWPADDLKKWRSTEAQCRCLPKQRAVTGYKFTKKNAGNKKQGSCNGCEECAWSIHTTSSWKKNPAEKMHRCRPAADYDEKMQWRGLCKNLYQQECGADCQECRQSWHPTLGGSCRCVADQIKKTVWGQHCNGKFDGECGSKANDGYCKDCKHSWIVPDEKALVGKTEGICRCKNWY